MHASIALFPDSTAPFVLAFLRFLVGATTAMAIPGLAATLAQALPKHRRTHAMSTCYGVPPAVHVQRPGLDGSLLLHTAIAFEFNCP